MIKNENIIKLIFIILSRLCVKYNYCAINLIVLYYIHNKDNIPINCVSYKYILLLILYIDIIYIYNKIKKLHSKRTSNSYRIIKRYATYIFAKQLCRSFKISNLLLNNRNIHKYFLYFIQISKNILK